jgi:hypothetical protein
VEADAAGMAIFLVILDGYELVLLALHVNDLQLHSPETGVAAKAMAVICSVRRTTRRYAFTTESHASTSTHWPIGIVVIASKRRVMSRSQSGDDNVAPLQPFDRIG